MLPQLGKFAARAVGAQAAKQGALALAPANGPVRARSAQLSTPKLAAALTRQP